MENELRNKLREWAISDGYYIDEIEKAIRLWASKEFEGIVEKDAVHLVSGVDEKLCGERDLKKSIEEWGKK